MGVPHVFVETNFLFNLFRLPSERRPDALELRAQFKAGQVKLYLPYLCLQEARNKISQELPKHRCEDLRQFHRFCVEHDIATWDFEEVNKLLQAATDEVSRTKAALKQELASFARALGDGLLHGTQEVFSFLEALELDNELRYNDKLVLSSVLVKAGDLNRSGERGLFFATTDRKDLGPGKEKPRLREYYDRVGLIFIDDFTLPESVGGLSTS